MRRDRLGENEHHEETYYVAGWLSFKGEGTGDRQDWKMTEREAIARAKQYLQNGQYEFAGAWRKDEDGNYTIEIFTGFSEEGNAKCARAQEK